MNNPLIIVKRGKEWQIGFTNCCTTRIAFTANPARQFSDKGCIEDAIVTKLVTQILVSNETRHQRQLPRQRQWSSRPFPYTDMWYR
jgi:hypothetical protein